MSARVTAGRRDPARSPTRPAASAVTHRAALNRRLGATLLYAALIAAAVAFAVPIAWLLVSSLKQDSEFGVYPIRFFPEKLLWSNYRDAVTVIPFFTYALRSFLLAGAFAGLTVLSSAFVGFGFARHRTRWRNRLFILVLAMLMVPGTVTVIPQFVLYSRLGLVGTYWPWILSGLSGSPFMIFLFRQYFSTFPRELEDAAELDGCNRLRLFVGIFMPNAGPVCAASAIIAFQFVWGDFFTPSLYLSGDRATLAMMLATAYVDPYGNPLYTRTLAAVVLFVLPLVLVFFVAQRSIVRGIVTTGIK
jgi:multiple sugar transport system permease protein